MSNEGEGPDCFFIGDDFTGASDTLATFARSGHRAKLFLAPPEAADMAGVQVVGLATAFRAMTANAIQAEIHHIGPAIAATGARFFHYKTCSTFDSSETIGSIGAAVNALREHIKPALTIIVGGQPSLRRYCHFGHLFAAAPDGEVYSIDRHPVMANHPVTPMSEPDLRLHLAGQGLEDIALINGAQLDDQTEDIAWLLAEACGRKDATILFDAGCQAHIERIGQALNAMETTNPVLLVGSSSIAEVLDYVIPRSAGALKGREIKLDQMLPCFIFAGSRSSVTEAQIKHASNFEKIALDPDVLKDPEKTQALARSVCDQLWHRQNVIVHLQPSENYGLAPDKLAELCARFVESVVQNARIGRLGIAGGDTSSMVVRELGIGSLSHLSLADKGVAICLAEGSEIVADLVVMLKGGQMGADDLFDRFASFKPDAAAR